MSDKCTLNKKPFHQCCCVCSSQAEIANNNLKGTGKYVCTAFLWIGVKDWGSYDIPVIENKRHGIGCEMWDDKKKDSK